MRKLALLIFIFIISVSYVYYFLLNDLIAMFDL